MTLSRALLTAIVAFALALLTGCGGNDADTRDGASSDQSRQDSGGGGGQDSASAGPAKQAVKVSVENFKYAPPTIAVKAGGTVTWTNGDQARHNAQTDSGAEGAFNTDDLDRGDSRKVTFEDPGEYAYYCVYPRFMKGTVQVK